MDPVLVNGIISGLAGAVGILGWAARRMVSNFDTVTVNNTKQTEHLGVLADGVRQNTLRIESLEKKFDDRRQEEATEASKEQTLVSKTMLAVITGKHAAITAEQIIEASDDLPPPTRRRT